MNDLVDIKISRLCWAFEVSILMCCQSILLFFKMLFFSVLYLNILGGIQGELSGHIRCQENDIVWLMWRKQYIFFFFFFWLNGCYGTLYKFKGISIVLFDFVLICWKSEVNIGQVTEHLNSYAVTASTVDLDCL